MRRRPRTPRPALAHSGTSGLIRSQEALDPPPSHAMYKRSHRRTRTPFPPFRCPPLRRRHGAHSPELRRCRLTHLAPSLIPVEASLRPTLINRAAISPEPEPPRPQHRPIAAGDHRSLPRRPQHRQSVAGEHTRHPSYSPDQVQSSASHRRAPLSRRGHICED
jgi:hypothetical protein